MATKRAKNGQNLEYIVIRPKFGFNIDQMADGVLLNFDGDIDKLINKLNTWNKVLKLFNYNLLDRGMVTMDVAWEVIGHYADYDTVHKQMVEHLKTLNKEIN